VILGITGPILTIIALLWVWYALHRKPGHVHRDEVQAVAAARESAGAPVFPPNVPFCSEHALLYPPRVTQCQVDRADLAVICPVDQTVRAASVQICPSCGTRYVLGAASSPLVVTSADGPPEGGAAVA
jgi:hypothetical protein